VPVPSPGRRRRALALATLFLLGLLVAFASPALAAGEARPETEVRDTRVTPAGRTIAPGTTSAAPAVPDHTNLVGVSWAGDGAATFAVETRADDGRWRRVGRVAEADGGPDLDTPEAQRAAAAGRLASDAIEVDDPANVRVRVAEGNVRDVHVVAVASPPAPAPNAAGPALATTGGAGALGAAVALGCIVPRVRRRQLVALLIVAATVGAAATIVVDDSRPAGAIPGQPRIISRAEWGADESLRLRNCPEGPNYSVPRMAVVHHTVNSNSYSPDGAVALVRSIYAYHTVGRNYCDVGYNFLVDRFGRIFEGRWGGVSQGVIGAHATNFNTGAFGVAMIGDFSGVGPPGAMANAVADLVVWKMSHHRMNPFQPIAKYGHVMDPINGHRDAGRVSGDGTACPGNGGYTIVPWLRQVARQGVQYGDPVGNVESVERRAPRTARVTGWALDPETTQPIAVHLYLDGRWLAAFTAVGDRPDVERVWWWLGRQHGFVVDVPVPLGTHLLCAYGISVGTGVNELIGCGATSGRPIGTIDRVSREGGNIRVRGWAIDPDVVGPISVHAYVDGQWGAAGRANKSRPDVGDVFPGYGPNHGYDFAFPASSAPHRVCVYGISRANDPNTLLRCRNLRAAT
jgi:hypothetical protein